MNVATLRDLLRVHDNFKYNTPLIRDQETTFCVLTDRIEGEERDSETVQVERR